MNAVGVGAVPRGCHSDETDVYVVASKEVYVGVLAVD